MARRRTSRRRPRPRSTYSGPTQSQLLGPDPFGLGGSNVPWKWIGLAAAAWLLLRNRAAAAPSAPVQGFEEELEAQGMAGYPEEELVTGVSFQGLGASQLFRAVATAQRAVATAAAAPRVTAPAPVRAASPVATAVSMGLTGRSELRPGERLVNGEVMKSPNGIFMLQFGRTNNDGNLILTTTNTNTDYWSTNKYQNGMTGAYFLVQPDGNIAVYKVANSPIGQNVLWQAGKYNKAGQSNARLVLQDDGNLVLYWGDKAVWSSNTYPSNNAKVAAALDATPQAKYNEIIYDEKEVPHVAVASGTPSVTPPGKAPGSGEWVPV